MKRMVMVHGMRQEGKHPDALRQSWENSLNAAWKRLGLNKPKYEIAMPFYGDVLAKLTHELRTGAGGVVARGGSTSASDFEIAALRQIAGRAGVDDAEIRGHLASEVIARGPANWEWVQAIGRALERKIPGLGTWALEFVEQVDAYLGRPHIKRAVDGVVTPALAQADRETVVVSHSLGTIVAYRILRADVGIGPTPLFATLGSPLGIRAVTDRISPPKLAIPSKVGRWVNGTDERDYVALYAKLDASNFVNGIENWDEIQNRPEDAHFIGDYLSNDRVAKAIHEALT